MIHLTVAIFLLVVFIICFVGYKIYRYVRYIEIIKKIPGPPRHPILGNLTDINYDQETMFNKARVWAGQFKHYYTIMSYPIISINIVGPEDIEILISSMKHSGKSLIYKFLTAWLGDGLLTSKGAKWQQRRKLLTPSFHFSILQEFIGIFQKETDHLLEKLETIEGQDNINIVPYITEFTLYSINETSMGVSLHELEEQKATYVKSILDIGELFTYRLGRPWLYFNFFYYNFFPSGFKELGLIRKLHAFTNKIIQEKVAKTKIPSQKKRLAMLDLLINAMQNDGSIDIEGIKDEINTFMFEGHDTTSMALCFTLMELAQHREVQKQLLQEINEVFDDPNEPVSYKKLNELNFMDRCLKECLRLYPSVPFISRLSEEDIVLSQNHLIPKKTICSVHIFDLHRLPEIYPDPEKFDPDRFLPENTINRHPFAYLPFSAGPRNCIGQRFAMLELKTALVGILRKFVLEPVDNRDTIKFAIDLVLRSNNGVRVKFVKRK